MFGDARLAHAWSHLDSGGADALVVDVFDTLLWRLAPRPEHLFLLLGERLAATGRLPAGVTPGQFAHLRILAERRARSRSLATRGWSPGGPGDGPPPRLDEIWAQLLPALPGAGERSVLVETEVAALRAVHRVDLAAAELVELTALKLGLPVYLVADTCLSAAQVDRLLARPELAGIPFGGPFTSADIGVGTADGLLGHVLAATGAPASRLLYLAGDPTGEDTARQDRPGAGGATPGGGAGDAPHAGRPTAGRPAVGMASPGRAGVTAVRRGGPARDLRATLAMEGLLDDPGDGALVDPEYGDFGLTALRARVLHTVEADAVPRALRRFWDTGATVFGPVMTGFAEWVVEQAQELGAREAFCLMRSGQFVASLLAGPGRDAGITARPLWASREVCALANVFEASPAELRAFLTHAGTGPAPAATGQSAPSPSAAGTGGGAVATVGALLRRLRVDLAAVPGISALAGRRLDVPAGLLDEILDELLETLSRDDRIRGEIVLAAERLRERFLRYLDGLLPERGPAVLVDLGWDGTTQALLARLLAATGREVTPVGLYLATGPAVLEHRLAGHRMEGYLASAGQPARLAGQLLRAPAVIEQVARADVGPLSSFDEAATPLLGLARTSRTQLAQRAAAQDGARAFQREWLCYRGAESPDSADSALPSLCGEGARLMLLRTLARFVARPAATEAAAFGSWRHDGEDDEAAAAPPAGAGAAHARGAGDAAGGTDPGSAPGSRLAAGLPAGSWAGAAAVPATDTAAGSVTGMVTGTAETTGAADQAGRGLLPAELIRRMPYLSPAGLAELPLGEAPWPAAVAAVANRPLAVVTELAAAGGVDPRELSAPAAAGPVEVYVDTGADFARGPKATALPYAGRDGLSLVRLRVVDAVGVRRVRVDPAGRRGLLRLDWLTLGFHVVGAGEPRAVTITAFDGPGAIPAVVGRSIPADPPDGAGLAERRRGIVLGLVGLRILQPNLAEILDDDPQLVYNLDLPGMPELGGTYAIDVEFAFGWIGIREDPLTVPGPAVTGSAAGPQLPRRAARRVMRQLGGLR